MTQARRKSATANCRTQFPSSPFGCGFQTAMCTKLKQSRLSCLRRCGHSQSPIQLSREADVNLAKSIRLYRLPCLVLSGPAHPCLWVQPASPSTSGSVVRTTSTVLPPIGPALARSKRTSIPPHLRMVPLCTRSPNAFRHVWTCEPVLRSRQTFQVGIVRSASAPPSIHPSSSHGSQWNTSPWPLGNPAVRDWTSRDGLCTTHTINHHPGPIPRVSKGVILCLCHQ